MLSPKKTIRLSLGASGSWARTSGLKYTESQQTHNKRNRKRQAVIDGESIGLNGGGKDTQERVTTTILASAIRPIWPSRSHPLPSGGAVRESSHPLPSGGAVRESSHPLPSGGAVASKASTVWGKVATPGKPESPCCLVVAIRCQAVVGREESDCLAPESGT
jgi:hypothetical protein